MITNFFPNNGITTIFQNLEKIIVFNIYIYIFIYRDSNPNAVIIHEDSPP